MMKKKIMKIGSLLLFASIFLTIGTNSKATVENKPGGTVHGNLNVPTSYQQCYDMRYGELGNNTLDPHLTTNADWAAAAYLGVSAYGSVRSKEGAEVSIEGTSYYSTTNNITGVINMGKNYTQTASLVQNYPRTNNWVIGMLTEVIPSKYIELTGEKEGDTINKGKAFYETSRWFGRTNYYATDKNQFTLRSGVLGFSYTDGISYIRDPNSSNSLITYRPVIWN